MAPRTAAELARYIDHTLLAPEATRDELLAVDAARRGVVVKVICELAALSDDELRATCKAAVVGGADFVKTSTGFHKAGGATERAVAIMRETVGSGIGVKASGGIRTTEAALAMIAAGATRIGASATREILAGMSS